jgi:predicted metal-binding protein
MKIKFVAMTFSSIFIVGVCANTWADDKSTVNCSTAADDLSALQHEKKHTDERKVKGVMSIMPIGLAVNAASDVASSDSHDEMQIDEYNKKLDARIAEIKSACDIE